MGKLTLFMTAADKERVLGDYSLVGADSPDFGQLFTTQAAEEGDRADDRQ
jgi:hypothetical protein